MKPKHAKSPCCHVKVRRYGQRRRQCVQCKRTWSIRLKKRGRPLIRPSANLLKQIFVEGHTLHHLARRRPGVRLLTFRHRFRQALCRFVARPRPQPLPAGPLIVLADGVRFRFRQKPWVLYLTALKSCAEHTAVFLDPLLLPGGEGALKWRQVFAAIPPDTQPRIQALVVDNLNGMKRIAKHHGWGLQLCHFHLLLKLQVTRRRGRRALQGGPVRTEIYDSIRHAIEVSEEPTLAVLVQRLARLATTCCGTVRMQATVRDFLHSLPYYRTYRAHPEWHLPTTTNTVESMASIIRDLLRRNRCASSPQSLLRWTTALIRMRRKLTCNGRMHQQI